MIAYDLVLDDDGEKPKWLGNHCYYTFRFMTHNNMWRLTIENATFCLTFLVYFRFAPAQKYTNVI